MGIGRRIRTYSSHHEWVGNIFSFLAVVLIFATVWATLYYYLDLMTWIRSNPLIYTPLLVAGLVVDALLIMVCLSIGSARADEEDERSFATFQGRRSGASPIGAFRIWLHHMENVGRKHR